LSQARSVEGATVVFAVVAWMCRTCQVSWESVLVKRMLLLAWQELRK